MARRLALVCFLAGAPIVSAQEGHLGARALYNAGLVDRAIELAEADWEATASAEAALVLARAKLDRFSRLESGADLSSARQLLDRIDVSTLLPAQRLDWEISVAAGLFLAGRAGPAVVMFERLLDHSLLGGAERDRVLNWWATAVDRVGRDQLPDRRSQTYGKMTRRLEKELERDPSSGPGAYWSVVAARGAGDPEQAWNLAVAAWVRAPVTGDPAGLRDDLDRLVLQGVIPDLASIRTEDSGDQFQSVRLMAQLTADWEDLKGH
jgi:hypothetical protein